MRLTLRLAMTLLAVTGPVEAAAAERCNDSHGVVTAAMQKDMIGKARLNGEVVTGVLLKGLCTSGFVTRSGVTWIDWTTVANDYAYRLGDTMLLKIPQNGKVDVVTYEGGPDVAIGIRMSLELLGSDCHDHAKFCQDQDAQPIANGDQVVPGKVGRVLSQSTVMLDVVRALSDKLVAGSADGRAMALEQALRKLERPLPRPDLANPFDWKGYGP